MNDEGVEQVGMNFSWALEQLKKGKSVKRKAFRDTCYIRMNLGRVNKLEGFEHVELPYIEMVKKMVDEKEQKEWLSYFPCDLSCESILAEDWIYA